MPIQGEGVGRISKDQGVMQKLRPEGGKGAGKERSEGRAPRQRESERVETLAGHGGGKAFALHSIQGPACSGAPGSISGTLGTCLGVGAHRLRAARVPEPHGKQRQEGKVGRPPLFIPGRPLPAAFHSAYTSRVSCDPCRNREAGSVVCR